MRRSTAILALMGILNPYIAFAQTPTELPNNPAAVTQMLDIQLDADGRMLGQVVDGSGKPLPSSKLTLVRWPETSRVVLKIDAGEDGMFKTAPLRAGTYRIHTNNGVIFCRCWRADAAPPKAAKGILVVDDPNVARGQQPIGQLFRTEPLLIAALVTAAVAIPIAVHKSRDDAPEGS